MDTIEEQEGQEHAPVRFRDTISWRGLLEHVIVGSARKINPALGDAVDAGRKALPGASVDRNQLSLPVGDRTESRFNGRSVPERVNDRKPEESALRVTTEPSSTYGSATDWRRMATSLSSVVSDGFDAMKVLEKYGFHVALTQAFDVISFHNDDYLSDGDTVLYTRGFFDSSVAQIADARHGFSLNPQNESEVRVFYDAMDRRKNETEVVAISPAVKMQKTSAEFVTLIADDGLMAVVNAYTLLAVLANSVDAESLNMYLFNSNRAFSNEPYTAAPVVLRDGSQTSVVGAEWLTVAILTPEDMKKGA